MQSTEMKQVIIKNPSLMFTNKNAINIQFRHKFMKNKCFLKKKRKKKEKNREWSF